MRHSTNPMANGITIEAKAEKPKTLAVIRPEKLPKKYHKRLKNLVDQLKVAVTVEEQQTLKVAILEIQGMSDSDIAEYMEVDLAWVTQTLNQLYPNRMEARMARMLKPKIRKEVWR